MSLTNGVNETFVTAININSDSSKFHLLTFYFILLSLQVHSTNDEKFRAAAKKQ
jgi:hypothetical protein